MPDHIVIGDIRPRIQYQADGVQTVFTYPFPIFAPEDLKVYLGEAPQATGYTVAGAGQSAGGSVTFAAAPAAGVTVTLLRALAIARTSDFQEGGAFRAKIINDELDRQTAFVQEAVERIERAIVAAPTEPAAPLVLPPPSLRANALLGFDAAGAPIAAAGPAGAVPVSTAMAPVVEAATLTAARQLLGALGNERLALAGAHTVANADKGKTLACAGGPWALAFAAPSGYDADFAALVLNEGARGIRLDLDGASSWLWPGQTALVYRQGASWRALRPERWRLAALTVLFVDAGAGSDANDGLAPGAGGALATIQAAVDRLADELDCAGQQAAIQLADGTYPAGAALRPYLGRVPPILLGNPTTPANVVVSTTNANAFEARNAGRWTIRDLKLSTTTAGHGLLAAEGSVVEIGNIDFGACVYDHILSAQGAFVQVGGDYEISGGANVHMQADGASTIECTNRAIDIAANPSFVVAFAMATNCSSITINGNAYSGSASGKRYEVHRNSVIQAGGGADYLPGSAAGATSTGGQYI